ncbi:hypothetical protein [Polaribacter sp. KT 15]|uniref:hypothetical protein n=1 Tax=Polaribacter sp. KT 15 TaxID=1896175 RepID=UPI00090BD8AA|nr:hypothetical protein [Polaribacter sp. KT 15]SHM90520.1 hypothetical protein SAMN05720268_1307 [Polaribacter sp. KT 15]
MKRTKKILASLLFTAFLFLMFSCDKKTTTKEKEDKILSSQTDAKLLVEATKNYIYIINYNNYIKEKDSVTPETKQILNSINKGVKERLGSIKDISRKEMILIPNVNDVLFLEKKPFVVNNKESNEKAYLLTLNKIIDKQVAVMSDFAKITNNESMNVLANESEYFLEEKKENIENLLNEE